MNNEELKSRNKNEVITACILLVMAIIAPIGLVFLNVSSKINGNNIHIGTVILMIVAVLDFFVAITIRNIQFSSSKILGNIMMILRMVYALYLFTIVIAVFYCNYQPENDSYEVFNKLWGYGLIVFGMHLLLVGSIIMQSRFISHILGVFVNISGIGYIFDNLIKIVYRNDPIQISQVTFIGEVLLIFWLPINVYFSKKRNA